MKTGSFSINLGILLSICLSLLLPACSNNGSEEEDSKDAASEDMEMQQAAADVISKAYAEGRLGPRDGVLANIEVYAQKERPIDGPVPRFVTTSGDLISYQMLTEDQRTAFNAWIYGPEVQAAIGLEIVRAQQVVKAKWHHSK